jgi:hypothetical protein
MTITELIFIKITLAIQTCENNYNTEFHENPTNGDVTETRPQIIIVRYSSCSTDTHLDIVLRKEENTIRNSSITNEIRILLTHQSTDPLKEKFLVLEPGLLHHLCGFN